MSDSRFMALALALGRRTQGQTGPNPAVGCVIVNQGRIVGRGWTALSGRPHAETQALVQAGSAALGGVAYVTLEPCAHHGKTPPCAAALIDAKVARVVIATLDPDPRVNGQGIQMLRDAGISVDVGIGAVEAERDLAGFMSRITRSRPFLTLKLANSFDGRIATAIGDSKWITAAPARRLVHRMRLSHDAVMIGGGTARTDDPALNVRGFGDDIPQPTRIVLSRRLDMPLMGQLAQTAKDIPVVICHGADADVTLQQTWVDLGATLISCRSTAYGVDPGDALSQLADHGINRIFCEGGGGLASSLIAANVVDELIGFTAGVTIGGDGLPSIAPMGFDTLAAAPRFMLQSTRHIGSDLLHIWVPISKSV